MILFILVLALILRILLIDQSFWLDEASQAMTSLRPLPEIIFHNLEDFHPPLSYVLTHFWIQFGRNEVWLRLLPVIFGVGTVYVLYLLGKRLFNEKVALLAALLLAIAPYHIYYSQEFRMYSMATFFAVVSMYFFVNLLENFHVSLRQAQGRKILLGFILSSSALLYTHYLGGILFLSQIIYLLVVEKKLFKQFIWIYGLIALLFLPWVPFLYQQLSLGIRADEVLPGWSSMLSLSAYKALPLLFTKFIIGRIDFNNSIIYGSVVLFSFSIIGSTFVPIFKKIKEQKVLLLLFWFFIPVLFTFLVSFKVPMFQPFRLLFILPAFLLLIAYGIFELKKFQMLLLRLVVVMLLLFQGIFLINSSYWREDWRGAVLEADKFTKDQGAVLFAWKEPFPPYKFYSEEQMGVGGLMPEVGERFVNGQISGPIVYFSYLGQLTDPERETQKMLENYGYREVEVKDFRGVGFVHFYVPRESTLGMK